MTIDLVARCGRSRLIAALALLAMVLAVATAGLRLGSGAGLFVAPEQDEHWVLVGDELPPAKVERMAEGLGGKNPSGPASSPFPIGALAGEAVALLQPSATPAWRPPHVVSARGDPPHRRPHPTGPPLLG